jgi:hypothetical protein
MADFKHDNSEVEKAHSPNRSDDSDRDKPVVVQEALDDDPVYSYQEQRKIIRRLDLRLISVAGVIYMNSLMDRSNLPNAGIAGMLDDLNMRGTPYVCIERTLLSCMQHLLI